MKIFLAALGCVSLILFSQPVSAEIYKWTDDKGTVHFTEDPAAIPEKYRDAVESAPSDKSSDEPKKRKSPSIEEVHAFPEKYLKYRMVFSQCRVSQDLTRIQEICKNCYAIAITSPGGKYVSSGLKRDGITFILLDSLAEKLAPDLKGGYAWTDCDVTCTIIERSGYYIAVVSQIDVCIPTWPATGRKIDKSYRDETLVKQ